MRFIDHLKTADIRKLNQLRKSSRNKKEYKSKKKYGLRPGSIVYDEMHEYPCTPLKQEKLSFKEIEELMGTRRDVYTRRNGAIRRK